MASSWSGGSAEIPCALCFLGLGFVGVKGDLKGSTLRNLSRWLRNSCISASRRQRSASSSTIFSSLTRSNSCSSRRVPIAVIVDAPVTFEMALWPAAATTATAPCVGSCEASSSSASRCCVDEKHKESKHTRIDTQASPIGTLHLVPSSIQPERNCREKRTGAATRTTTRTVRRRLPLLHDSALSNSGGPTPVTSFHGYACLALPLCASLCPSFSLLIPTLPTATDSFPRCSVISFSSLPTLSIVLSRSSNVVSFQPYLSPLPSLSLSIFRLRSSNRPSFFPCYLLVVVRALYSSSIDYLCCFFWHFLPFLVLPSLFNACLSLERYRCSSYLRGMHLRSSLYSALFWNAARRTRNLGRLASLRHLRVSFSHLSFHAFPSLTLSRASMVV